MMPWSRHQNDSEKLSLRGHAPSRWSIPCVFRSRKALIFCTRLVFTVTIFTGFGVIFASIWFMLDCRQNFNSMQALIPKHSSFCTNLGMQALFACCVLLFTIFGLGCIGRRMTGHAILIISGVAIFQGAMTLIFYECRAMADDDILKAVNKTLSSCRVGTRAPFATYPSDVMRVVDKRKTHKNNNGLAATARSQTKISGADSRAVPVVNNEEYLSPSSAKDINNSRTIMAQLNQNLKRKLEVSIEADSEENVHKTAPFISIQQRTIMCHDNSGYFVSFSKTHRLKDVRICQMVCKAYQRLCYQDNFEQEIEDQEEPAHGGPKRTNGQSSNDFGTSVQGSSRGVMTEFETEALICGDKIARYVSHFCIYDNRIFTPMSLGTPIFYILVSLCFIYLAHCDRNIKAEDIFEPRHLRSGSTSSTKSSRHSVSSKTKDRTDFVFSSPSPPEHRQETRSMPSPALSDSSWCESTLGRELFYRESQLSPRQPEHSGSARTLETYLGDD